MKKIICLLGMAAMFNFGTVNAQVVKEKHKRPMSRGAKSSIIGGVAGAGVGALVGGGKGAIIGGADDTAAAKMKIMDECGIHVVKSPADIGKTMAQVLNSK